MYWFLGILAAILLFIIVLVTRAALTKKPALPKVESVKVELDENSIAKHLSQAIQIPTVSMVGAYKDNSQAFFDFHKFLETTYPTVTKTAKKTIINTYSLVYKFEGSDSSLRPGAFCAHQDVVPAPTEGWEVPPFSGELKDGYIYGRGAQDMKGTLIALMEAMETLLKLGFKPKRDVYFCFGHDEEPMSSMDGAPEIVKWFKGQNIELEFVVDEGGATLDGKLLGIKSMVALIGTCEKGYCDFKLTSEKDGGHASNPSKPSNMALISNAILKLERNPMPAKWTDVTKETFKYLSPYMNFAFKTIMVNRDLLGWLLKPVLTKIPITNALLRTTFAPTMIEGNIATNVLPPVLTANVNCRILTGESIAEVKDYMQEVVGDKITISYQGATEPTPVSSTESEPYKNLISAINSTFDGFVAAPYMFIAGTDSRYYTPICKNVYRFTPFIMTIEDQKRVHALNERVSPNDMVEATQFFANCIKQMS